MVTHDIGSILFCYTLDRNCHQIAWFPDDIQGYWVMGFTRVRAFTMIELLVVVAVIATLSAIAIPTFLRAQTKAQIASSHQDLVVLQESLMIRSLDNPTAINRHADPLQAWLGTSSGDCAAYMVLTTPINFIGNIRDVEDIFFRSPEALGFPQYYPLGECYSFYSPKEEQLASASVGRGPDSFYQQQMVFPFIHRGLSINRSWMYDPTNGLHSIGDLVVAPGARFIHQ